MRLTTMTDYALRLLMYVAARPERLCTIAEVAGAYGISETHLMKVTHHLASQGLLKTVRGKGGGMRLALDPADIWLDRVVDGVEADFDLVECFSSHGQCVISGSCRLAGVLQGALRAFRSHLAGFTLADLLHAPRPASVQWPRRNAAAR